MIGTADELLKALPLNAARVAAGTRWSSIGGGRLTKHLLQAVATAPAAGNSKGSAQEPARNRQWNLAYATGFELTDGFTAGLDISGQAGWVQAGTTVLTIVSASGLIGGLNNLLVNSGPLAAESRLRLAIPVTRSASFRVSMLIRPLAGRDQVFTIYHRTAAGASYVQMDLNTDGTFVDQLGAGGGTTMATLSDGVNYRIVSEIRANLTRGLYVGGDLVYDAGTYAEPTVALARLEMAYPGGASGVRIDDLSVEVSA